MKNFIRSLFFLVVCLPSYSVLADTYKIISISYNPAIAGICGLHIGATYSPETTKSSCIGKSGPIGIYTFTVVSVTYHIGGAVIKAQRNTGGIYDSRLNHSFSDCPPNTSVNPSTGVCEETPVCEEGERLNPNTFECEPIPFCERDSTTETIFQREQACAEQGGIFTYQCHNGDQIGFPQSLDTKCSDPTACVMGLPNWPECMDDIDPTNPISEPSGDFDGGNPGTANPNINTVDKDTADDVTPTDSTDTAVLEAIRNFNRDNNQALTGLDTDLNKGFNDLNNSLTQLNDTNKKIGQSVREQMKQDYQIYHANKTLALQQTGAIMNGTSTLNNAISNQTNALTSSIDALAEKIGDGSGDGSDTEPCDPNSDERSCEGEHGLTSDYVSNALGQMVGSVDAGMSSAESTLLTEAQRAVSDPMTDDIELVIHDTTGLLLGVFPNAGDCQPFELPTLSDKEYYIDCQWSNQLKMIFSFCMYVFTIYTLASILLEDITPQAGTVPYGSRRL